MCRVMSAGAAGPIPPPLSSAGKVTKYQTLPSNPEPNSNGSVPTPRRPLLPIPRKSSNVRTCFAPAQSQSSDTAAIGDEGVGGVGAG